MKLPLALAFALLLFAAACGGGRAAVLEDAAISANDVPSGWLAADLDSGKGQALWDALPGLLKEDSEARLILHAFEEASGLHGAATMFIETENASALPESSQEDEALASLGRLLMREDALLLPNPRGGDPNAYFASSEMPVPGSIRSRLVRLVDDDLVHSDSVTFSVGNVLAVVTVWYPEAEGPFQDVIAVAANVGERLQSFVENG